MVQKLYIQYAKSISLISKVITIFITFLCYFYGVDNYGDKTALLCGF